MKSLCESCFNNADTNNVTCEALSSEVGFDKEDPGKIIKCFQYISDTKIEDSGNRTEFETGAVRDIHTGKGRYDLIPWDAIHELAIHCELGALKYGERNCEKGIPIHSLIDSASRHISCYMRGQKDENHLRAAMWNIAFAIEMELNHSELQDIPNRLDND